MPKLIILSGLPASGKSTRAKEIIDQGNWVRVNRDLLRTMLHFDKFTPRNEEVTVKTTVEIARQALYLNRNVVVDDCNFSNRIREVWKNLARETRAQISVEEIDTPWQECIRRDANREKSVGGIVIKNMAVQYGKIQFKPDSVVLCDLDGTLADCEHRRHFLEGETKDWKGFFSEMHKDQVRKDVAKKIIDLYNQGKTIVYVSARPEKYMDVTLKWLDDNMLSFGLTIIMRRDGDTRPDVDVKQQILNIFFPNRSVIHKVIDDRPSVIRMWRQNGLEVDDVGDGREF